ncbi:MAG: hypothetical protein Q8R28_00930, partial [Dehalococcoidia bacterium]|nr:hypothetical protein [Dehalococcoidia bacterium]
MKARAVWGTQDVLDGAADWTVELGDCLEVLRLLPDACVDSVVTDPPAGIEFMGVAWDTYRKGGQPRTHDLWDAAEGHREHPREASEQARIRAKAGVFFRLSLQPIFEECLRVLKPGGHALVWALPRTSHWTATAIEDAGFEVRDVITHHFGSGFPKSLDVSKAIDKAAGAERLVVAIRPAYTASTAWREAEGRSDRLTPSPITTPATSEAARWEGWGTALKPASEHWILARKPLSEKTVAANVLKHDTGALNIDGTRVGVDGGGTHCDNRDEEGRCLGHKNAGQTTSGETIHGPNTSVGRFPPNLLLSHASECVEIGAHQVTGSSGVRGRGGEVYGGGRGYTADFPVIGQRVGYVDADGKETVALWACVPGCPIRELDSQTGTTKGTGKPQKRVKGKSGSERDGNASAAYGAESRPVGTVEWAPGDGGGASRFFPNFDPNDADADGGVFGYFSKANRSEREAGLADMEKQP